MTITKFQILCNVLDSLFDVELLRIQKVILVHINLNHDDNLPRNTIYMFVWEIHYDRVQHNLYFRMRNSPRKRSGATACSTPVEIFSLHQLNGISIGELRHLAAEKHGVKNAALLKKPELLTKLREHFETRHGLELKDEREDTGLEVSPISQTIDKLRNRIKVSIYMIFFFLGGVKIIFPLCYRVLVVVLPSGTQEKQKFKKSYDYVISPEIGF